MIMAGLYYTTCRFAPLVISYSGVRSDQMRVNTLANTPPVTRAKTVSKRTI